MDAHEIEWLLFGAAVVALFLLLFWFFGYSRSTRGPARRKNTSDHDQVPGPPAGRSGPGLGP